MNKDVDPDVPITSFRLKLKLCKPFIAGRNYLGLMKILCLFSSNFTQASFDKNLLFHTAMCHHFDQLNSNNTRKNNKKPMKNK